MAIHPALIGKAGEMMVAAELMRRGVEVAQPHSDVGVDLLAYRLEPGSTVPVRIVPIQVKAASGVRFSFDKRWLEKSANLVLAWRLETVPEFYVFDSLSRIDEALGATFSASKSWTENGLYAVTNPGSAVLERMAAHRDQWDRLISQL
ncbi:hypothetical protein GOFOIKOB_1438 [Methylobacterium tardum]|uniref:DUF4365 domain-containing protein n=1 Tax=Methylobacterium tardum TaxID=374432 RepID=A0AA37TJJ9_9HYPH|nr:hypothetical protein [Methylobacterium tardum]URD34577.1 hypothetical protein M6G65_18430 [Methylobacterium tardum]GJE48409.1 hypothetical protein GOFOIKOB_1438 [Methylobacterium tardum]GLS73020.1 hypothetical protein GCM10007890_50350 [Methylobacterium tardum]